MREKRLTENEGLGYFYIHVLDLNIYDILSFYCIENDLNLHMLFRYAVLLKPFHNESYSIHWDIV